MDKIKAKIVGRKLSGDDAVLFDFKLGKPLKFRAGQYVLVFKNFKGVEDRRAYSICSPPENERDIQILVKKQVPGGFAENLHKSKVGETLEISQAFGEFCFEEGMVGRIVLISAGSGITPFMSMIRHVINKKIDVDVTLLNCAKRPEGLFFKEELKRIEKEHENIDYFLRVTRPEPGDKWKGEVGRIDEECLRKHVEHPKESFYYICGPPPMIGDIVKILSKLGVKEEHIKREMFG